MKNIIKIENRIMKNTYVFFDEKSAQGYVDLCTKLGHKVRLVKGEQIDSETHGMLQTWNVEAAHPKTK